MWKSAIASVAVLASFASFAAVDVNQAAVAELDGIHGIGPSVSSRILDERKKGLFKDWRDLIARVKGIGNGNARRYSAQGLTVNGAAFEGAAGSAPAQASRAGPAPAAATR